MWGKLQRVFSLSSRPPPVQSHFLVGRIFSCIFRKICRLISADENLSERKIEFSVIQWNESRDELFSSPASRSTRFFFLLDAYHDIFSYQYHYVYMVAG